MTLSPSLLADIAPAVCAEVSALLPDLARCAPHAGKFDLGELKKSGVPAPAVLVATLGAKQARGLAGRAVEFDLRCAAYVVTRDGLGKPRDLRAAVICQVLLGLIPGRTWNNAALGAAREVELHTLVSEATRDVAASLWAVTWVQPFTLFSETPAAPGVALYVGEYPATGAAHEDDYTQIGGGS